jgi:hypothetical protein
MTDFIVKQGDTISINYVIPDINLSMKKIQFCFGDNYDYAKTVTCKRQSISTGYIPLTKGGLTIPFTGDDLDRAGSFMAEFRIFSRTGEKTTYPQIGYLTILVQKSI